MAKKDFPRFYRIDDVLVKVDIEKDEVFGVDSYGTPYPPGKALVDGVELSKEEYLRYLHTNQ